MPLGREEYPFLYVILRYLPDFARDEFINGGIILYDMHHQSVLGQVSRNAAKYWCIDREGRYKVFVEAAESLLSGLLEEIKAIKEGIQETGDEAVSALVEKAFMRRIMPNAGFCDFSNIRSGVTDDIDQKFKWLYKRFVHDVEEHPAKETAMEVVNRLLDEMREEFVVTPSEEFLWYDVTGGRYSFEVSFGHPYSLYMKVIGMQARKKGTPDLRNVLHAVTVLEDLKEDNPASTFGIILHIPNNIRPDAAQRAIEAVRSRISKSKLDLVLAVRKELITYLKQKRLLRSG